MHWAVVRLAHDFYRTDCQPGVNRIGRQCNMVAEGSKAASARMRLQQMRRRSRLN